MDSGFGLSKFNSWTYALTESKILNMSDYEALHIIDYQQTGLSMA